MLGERCLNCDQYSRCLAFAAEKDWESFTCRSCGYSYRGRANFGIADFAPIEENTCEEGVYIFCQSQVDGLKTLPRIDLDIDPQKETTPWTVTS